MTTSPQFAPVAPVHILQELLRSGNFGTYHLFLAHHTVEAKAEFTALGTNYNSDRTLAYQNATIIMDNSLVELGGAVDDAMIREAVTIVREGFGRRHTVVPVLPDVMGKGAATINLAAEGYKRWVSYKTRMPNQGGYMLVTQGETWEDFTALVNYFFVDNLEAFEEITWVGVPRKLVEALGSRLKATRYIQAVAPHVRIHLLGFSDDIVNDVFTARICNVWGIDSAVPVRYAEALKLTTTGEEIGPRGTWWADGKLTTQNLKNLDNSRKWLTSRG